MVAKIVPTPPDGMLVGHGRERSEVQLVERCQEPAEVAARSSCGSVDVAWLAFQLPVPDRTERQRICWPTQQTWDRHFGREPAC
jgi:hypothetical protein